MARLPRALVPLRSGGYRLLAASMALTLFGQGLWTVGVVWQVVALGGGPAVLGLVTGAGAAGMLATALLGGVLADRVPLRRVLLAVALLQTAAAGAAAVLSLTGALTAWQLGGGAALVGVATGLYYPAYTALVPALVPEGDLLAVNGLEGAVRPLLTLAAGPAAAGALVAASSPGAALAATALVALLAAGCVRALPATPSRREPGAGPTGVLADAREGLAYVIRTPWLLATLLFAAGLLLVYTGPFEVLVPFAVREAGGGPAHHAWVLASLGVGGAVGSLVVASLRLPRRYLTVMNLLWGLGCLPMVVFGVAPDLWLMLLAGTVIGATSQAGMVVWGTLLQRRVPPELLGRVSSLDFFVSLSLIPVSMALAGPVSAAIGPAATFLVAGLAPPVMAVLAVVAARLPADELAHPLDGATRSPAPAAAWMGHDAGTAPAREGEP